MSRASILILLLCVGWFSTRWRAEELATAKHENAILQSNVKALEKKIEVDTKVQANDAVRAVEDAKRITTFKEKSRATIQGTKDPGHVALDADATQRVRDIFAQH